MKRITLVALVIVGCSAQSIDQTPSTVTLATPTFSAHGATLGGLLTTVDVLATALSNASASVRPISGVVLTYSTSQSGVIFIPGTVTTGPDGHGVATTVIPWGMQLLASIASANGGYTSIALGADPIQLASTQNEVATLEPGGALVTLTVVANVPASASAGTDAGVPTVVDASAPTVVDAGVVSPPAAGVQIAFGTNTTGVAFAPGTVLTDLSGQATSRVFVPYGGSEVVATISGGGASVVIPLSQNLPAVMIGTPQYSDLVVQTVGTGTGTQGIRYTLTTRITLMDGKTPIQALPVSFAQVGVSGSNNPFTPASTMTDANGQVETNVFVPMLGVDAGVLSYVVTAGGVSEAFTLP